ncbi:DNA/RNA non-specific endonuclease [Micromonospora sp. NPDC003197]
MVGNRAVTGMLTSGPIVVQRATRDDLLTALRAAVQAGQWQEVATRLNGFNTADIKRLAAGLSVGEAANTRAAVATYLAGWPQEETIIAALDAGRAEVARIGRIYQAYEHAVRDGDWPTAVRQLHAMSDGDIAARLGKLPPDSLRALCGAAPELSERITRLANSMASQRGVEVPDGLGRLVVGGRDLGAVREFRTGGESTVEITAPAARGEGASIGARQIAEGLLLVSQADVPLTPASEAAIRNLLGTAGSSAGAGGAGTTALAGAEGSAVATGVGGAAPARIAVSLAIRVPVVGVAFMVGLLGPVALGWAIVHAEVVDKALKEYGGTLPPGGGLAQPGVDTMSDTGPAPVPQSQHGHQDDDGDCQDCKSGTDPLYGPLDDLGRATGVRAILKGRSWSGQKPQEYPAGFVRGISGSKAGGQQARAHLLAKVLGGNGSRRNLVPFGQVENVRMYWQLESRVKNHLDVYPEHCVEFVSTPQYPGRILSASLIHLFARDLCTGKIIVNEPAYNRTLH